MEKINAKLILLGIMLLCNLYSIAEKKILCVHSIDTLKNNVYLICLKDSCGVIYKSVSIRDTTRILPESHIKIEKGLTESFNLKSLYREQLQWMIRTRMLHIEQYYKGVNIRGNKIPVESDYRTRNDVFKILNSNGLDLYSYDVDIDNNNPAKAAVKSEDVWISELNFVKLHIQHCSDFTEFIIYCPMIDSRNDSSFYIISRDNILYYSFNGNNCPSINSYAISSDLCKSVDELFIIINKLKGHTHDIDLSMSQSNVCGEYFAYYLNKQCQFEYLLPIDDAMRGTEYELVNRAIVLIVYLCAFSGM